jgi:hypothetical protein
MLSGKSGLASATYSFTVTTEGRRTGLMSSSEYSSLRCRVNNDHKVLMSINTIHHGTPLSLVPPRSSCHSDVLPVA